MRVCGSLTDEIVEVSFIILAQNVAELASFNKLV